MARFSVQTHRGCFGRCSFCALSLHQGDRIVSRSEASILEEIRRMTKHPEFKGYVDDLGGPTANMYGFDRTGKALPGTSLREGGQSSRSPEKARAREAHQKLLALMRKARRIPGVKKIFVRSGIRYDLALESPEYVEELSRYHVSGLLKIAPEHVSKAVLRLMNKSGGVGKLETFRRMFEKASRGARQHLKYYFMVAHPGTADKDARELASYVSKLERSGEKPVEGVQIFTPTPMTRSACMYHTGKDPVTGESVYVPWSYAEKKAQRRMLGGKD
jgi:uncharacterized radical SAM protein YgiQ